jgi:S-DNA-T family DNA segregation ATPase FtsK/SpoIIIE
MSKEGGILRPIIAVIVIALALLLFLSLVTFDPDDVAFFRAEPNRPVHNWSGIAGAYLAKEMLFWFGLASYALVGMGVAWAVVWLIRGGVTNLLTRLAGVLVFVLTVATALSMPESALNYGYGPSAGGAVGLAGARVMRHFFAVQGAVILLAALGILSAILATDLLFYELIGAAGRRISQMMRARGSAPARRRRFPAPMPARAEVKGPVAEPEKEEPEEEVEEPRPQPVIVRPPEPPKKAVPLFEVVPDVDGYEFPSVDILDRVESSDLGDTEGMAQQNAAILERTLKYFGIEASVVRVERGPVVTLFELELAPGIKVNRVISLADDLAISLRAAAVRVVAPIPGKSTIGVEVPNTHKDIVRLRELIERCEDKVNRYSIPLLLGKDISGDPLVADLGQMPHLLIAGTTGSGKSVCLNGIIVTLLMRRSPRDVKLLLIDPKMVEMTGFKGIPHLLMPIVTDLRQATLALTWATKEMDKRYDLLALMGTRDIRQYNKLGADGIRKRLSADIEDGAELDDVPMHLPYVIIIVDELADLMMASPKEMEYSITRLSQKSRAVGIHIIVATQRPSVDVITGLIKANMPGRVAFQVSAKTDSRIILDQNGAERLLGSGDMLFLGTGTSKLVRAQGTYTSDGEIRRVVSAVTEAAEATSYEVAVDSPRAARANGIHELPTAMSLESSSRDALYDEAVRVVLQTRRGSVSLLQRKLEIGYTRAARLVDMMAEDGIVGGYKGSKAREVIISPEEWEERQGAQQRSS